MSKLFCQKLIQCAQISPQKRPVGYDINSWLQTAQKNKLFKCETQQIPKGRKEKIMLHGSIDQLKKRRQQLLQSTEKKQALSKAQTSTPCSSNQRSKNEHKLPTLKIHEFIPMETKKQLKKINPELSKFASLQIPRKSNYNQVRIQRQTANKKEQQKTKEDNNIFYPRKLRDDIFDAMKFDKKDYCYGNNVTKVKEKLNMLILL